MFNWMLFLLFVGYLISLFFGFLLYNDKKEIINLEYEKFKNLLRFLIFTIFFINTASLIYLQQTIPWTLYLFFFNIAFIAYFISFSRKKSRCWKQHKMLIYNFLTIPLLYLTSLAFAQEILLFVLLVYLYTVIEFQFARFNPAKKSPWD